jgi:hypothetical protein
MDKFIIKRKRKVDEESEKDDSVESQTLKSETVTVVTLVRAVLNHLQVSLKFQTKNVKADKLKYRYYNESYIKYEFVSI